MTADNATLLHRGPMVAVVNPGVRLSRRRRRNRPDDRPIDQRTPPAPHPLTTAALGVVLAMNGLALLLWPQVCDFIAWRFGSAP
jgi:hypothetical protein